MAKSRLTQAIDAVANQTQNCVRLQSEVKATGRLSNAFQAGLVQFGSHDLSATVTEQLTIWQRNRRSVWRTDAEGENSNSVFGGPFCFRNTVFVEFLTVRDQNQSFVALAVAAEN